MININFEKNKFANTKYVFTFATLSEGISDKKILFKKEIKFANTKNVFTFAAAFRVEQRKKILF